MRTQIAKSAHLPAEYIPPTFWLDTPSPLFRRLTVGAAIEKNFFYFFKTLTLTRQVFTRYSLSAFIFSRFILVWFWFRIYFISLRIMASIWFLDFIFSILYFDSFYSLNFTRIKLCRFYALTLQLFISSACYKQTSMLMWVCFMLILVILRLSDVFSFVLGVVYRLGLK